MEKRISGEGTSKADTTIFRGKEVRSVSQEQPAETWQSANISELLVDEWIKREKQKTHKAAKFAKGLLSLKDTEEYVKKNFSKKLAQEEHKWWYCTNPHKEFAERAKEIEYLYNKTGRKKNDLLDTMHNASCEINSYSGYINLYTPIVNDENEEIYIDCITKHIEAYNNARDKFIEEHLEELNVKISSDEMQQRKYLIQDLREQAAEYHKKPLITAFIGAYDALNAYYGNPYVDEKIIKTHVEAYNQAKENFFNSI